MGARSCGVKHISKSAVSIHFWTFNRYFVWQAQRILHFAKGEQKREGRFCSSFSAMGGMGRSKMHFPWQAQCKKHVHQRFSEVRALIS
jgi:hypothetical protein